MICFPNAKINIGLNIVSERSDGYHDIETLFYPVNIQDVLEITLRKVIRPSRPLLYKMMENGTYYEDERCSLTIKGNMLPGDPKDNLVVRAFRMLSEDFDIPPVDIMLYKHIPSGAGLAGGSSDCASLIKMVNRRFGLRMKSSCMERYAARLGADCAFFVRNTPVIATGIGNIMTPFNLSLKGYALLLVKPDIDVSTKEAYSLVTPSTPEESLSDVLRLPVPEWRGIVKNDFEKSIFALHPEIGVLKEKMYDIGAEYAAMSGSGSTVYGLFRKPVENAESFFSGYSCIQRMLV